VKGASFFSKPDTRAITNLNRFARRVWSSCESSARKGLFTRGQAETQIKREKESNVRGFFPGHEFVH
jgi:hypothetical protein